MHRNLSDAEIETLKNQGCTSGDWSKIFIKDHSSIESVLNSHFTGVCRLGVFKESVEAEKGIFKKSGIFNSYLSGCIIGDNARISNVTTLANYLIGDNVLIENAGTIIVAGETTFGNGIEIEVLNEGGGRELTIFDRLSAQIAYLMVMYRHDNQLIESLKSLAGRYSENKKSAQGTIGSYAKIRNTITVKNVNIGEYAVVSGALLLEEGTIDSGFETPTLIGEGVVSKKFIILSGSRVDSGAVIASAFVGQGVQIGKQFSAEGSAFFANSEAFHGEACSIFAGPYTVTHHKSTLLIAGMFSFFNAGSGTNQSNHMYKLGPVHQGIVERGSKTGSFSYLLWPCKIGPYTVVMDKHSVNFDTSDLPFSYITVEEGKSVITPAMNLFTVGTRRDSTKWPVRDRRKGKFKLDLINFEFLNPFIMGKVLRGSQILQELSDKTPKEKEYVLFKGVNILRLMLRTTRKYYEILVKIYIGQEIVKRLNGMDKPVSFNQVVEYLKPSGGIGSGPWVDLSGMYLPQAALNNLLDQIKTGEIKSVEQLQGSFETLYKNYQEFAWNWCSDLIEQRLETPVEKMTGDQLIQLVEDGRSNALKLNNMIIKDAEKEFDTISKIGFGSDGDETVRDMDFENVRGSFEKNSFVTGLIRESEQINSDSERLINKLKGLISDN